MRVCFHGLGLYRGDGPSFGPSVWPRHDIIVAFKGRIALESDGTRYELREGDALLIPPHNPFGGRALSEEMAMWVFHFEEYRPGHPDSPFAVAREPSVIPGACRTRGDRLLMEEFTQRYKSNRRTAAEERVLALLGEALLTRFEEAWADPPREEPPWLRRALEVALAAPTVQGVASMAQQAGVSPSYFRLTFREYYGTSPQEYLQKRRMEGVKRTLCETHAPLKEIALAAGYSEPAAFHRAFRRETGMTPAQYRKLYGGVV